MNRDMLVCYSSYDTVWQETTLKNKPSITGDKLWTRKSFMYMYVDLRFIEKMFRHRITSQYNLLSSFSC